MFITPLILTCSWPHWWVSSTYSSEHPHFSSMQWSSPSPASSAVEDDIPTSFYRACLQVLWSIYGLIGFLWIYPSSATRLFLQDAGLHLRVGVPFSSASSPPVVHPSPSCVRYVRCLLSSRTPDGSAYDVAASERRKCGVEGNYTMLRRILRPLQN